MANIKSIEIYWRGEPKRLLQHVRGLTYSTETVPNPSKVVIIFEELQIPYTGKYVELEGLKKEPFMSINPNGRVPGKVPPLCRPHWHHRLANSPVLQPPMIPTPV